MVDYTIITDSLITRIESVRILERYIDGVMRQELCSRCSNRYTLITLSDSRSIQRGLYLTIIGLSAIVDSVKRT